MNTNRLAAAIKQEVLRNKKKSAILGVMCLVACYFWVPLLWGWFAPDDDEEDFASAEPASFVVDSAASAAPAFELTAPATGRRTHRREIPWQDLLRRIDEDPRMASAGLATLDRSPFEQVRPLDESPAVAEPPPPTEVAVEAPSPAEVELHLTGIVYGPRTRIATINGVEYHEQERIPIAANVPAPIAGGESDDMNTADRDEAVGKDQAGQLDEQHLSALRIRAAGERQRDNDEERHGEQSDDDANRPGQGAAHATPPQAASLGCVVAAIRPKSVTLEFSNGTVRELPLGGARLDIRDTIKITRTGLPQ